MIGIRKDKGWMRTATLAALLTAASFAAGISPAASQTKLTFLLNVPPAGYNAGFELAVEKGFYKDAGLDVTIEPGNGSQTTGLARWGDYSTVSVDPVDGCTMVFTTEYLPANGTFNWTTYIYSFKLSTCQ